MERVENIFRVGNELSWTISTTTSCAQASPRLSTGLAQLIHRGRASRSRSFIVTSHVMSELDEVSDNVVLLCEGRVRYSGPVVDLKRLTRQLSLERAVASFMEEAAA